MDFRGLPPAALLQVCLSMYDSSVLKVCFLAYVGRGYQLKLGDKIYSFPDFERAPPEGYFSQDYVA